MNVAAILKLKGRAVATVREGDTLATVAQILANRRIGAVVVTNARGGIAGIVSERDIVRAIAERSDACASMWAGQVMTRPVETCSDEDTLDELMERMTERRVRHLPVLSNGRLDGIISIGDVVKHHVAEVEMEASAMREYIAQH
jgi:CBS domain-containing protein